MAKMMKVTRSQQANLIRNGSIEITCASCKTKMQPNSDDFISCPKCGKKLAPGDEVLVKKDLRVGRMQ